MCNIAPGMPHDVVGLQPNRDSMKNSAGFFGELLRRGAADEDAAYYRKYDPDSGESADIRNDLVGRKGPDVWDDNSSPALIFVTGYFGAPIIEIADEIAEQEGMDLLLLDRAIEKKDGRSIRRICMAGGEHGYRNLEYEAVEDLHRATLGNDMGSEEASGRSGSGEGGDFSVGSGEGDVSSAVVSLPERGLVVACGDGILYDDETRALIMKHELIIAGEGMKPDKLWANALADDETWHAFMLFGTDEEKRTAFYAYHKRQKELFRQVNKTRGTKHD